MDEEPRVRPDHGPPARRQDAAGTGVARHIALMRQKHELRRERDRLLVDLGQRLGRTRMAELLGVTSHDAERLLSSARKRLESTLPGLFAEPGDQITVRRLRARQTAGHGRGDAGGDAASDPRGTHQRDDHPRTPSQRPPRIVAGRGAPGDQGARWVDADAHYETLARESSGR